MKTVQLLNFKIVYIFCDSLYILFNLYFFPTFKSKIFC